MNHKSEYEAIKKQNVLLNDQIQKNKGIYSTYDKQSFYAQEKIDTYKKMNFINDNINLSI